MLYNNSYKAFPNILLLLFIFSAAASAQFGISTVIIPNGEVGASYGAQITASGGAGTPAYSASGLPAGLGISAGGGISGVPTSAGTYQPVVTATLPGGASASRQYNVTIIPGPSLPGNSLPQAGVGQPYQAIIAVSGGTAPFTLSGSGTPPGILFENASLVGTPTTAGTYSMTFTVTDMLGVQSAPRQYSLTVSAGAALSLSVPCPFVGAVGQSYSCTVSASGGSPPYAFSASGLPPGLSMSPPGTIVGTPGSNGNNSVTITVTDSHGNQVSKGFNLFISAGLLFVNPSLPSGKMGEPYAALFQAQGGTMPYTFSVGGTLPPGTLFGFGNSIYGTPTQAGTYTVTATVIDFAGTQASRTFQITISPGEQLVISTQGLPDGTVGQVYGAAVSASGGTSPYLYYLSSGTLPDLNIGQDGSLSGIPHAAGTYTFTITVRDAIQTTASKQFSIVINGSPSSFGVTTLTLANGVVGQNYSQLLTSANGVAPVVYTASGLPGGLTVSGAAITGSPLAPGTFSITINATDSKGAHASRALPLTISAAGTSVLTINNSSLPNGTVGRTYSQVLTASGGASPYTFDLFSDLPLGLAFNHNGTISGTPKAAGSSVLNITVTDSQSNRATTSLSFTIDALPGNLTIQTTSLAKGAVGQSYSQAVSGSGGTPPYSFTESGLPPGLVISTSGNITGTPTTAGVFAVSINVTDALSGSASAPFSLTVSTPPSILTSQLPPATIGQAYLQNILVSGGTPPYLFSVQGQLPGGLALSQTGVLSGTPTLAGNTSFKVQVVDNNQDSATRTFQLTLNALSQNLSISAASLQFSGAAGAIPPPQNLVITSSSGSAPYSLQIDDGAGGPAPVWLNVTPAAGQTPAVIRVSVAPSAMTGKSGTARIRVGTPQVDIPVAIALAGISPRIVLAPSILRFKSSTDSPKMIFLRAEGTTDPIPYTATATNGNLLDIHLDPASGSLAPNQSTPLRVTVNAASFTPGSYRETVQITTTQGVIEVPVVLSVSASGPVMTVSPAGVQLIGTQAKQVSVRNTGDAGTSVNWTAQAIRGADLITITNESGISTTTTSTNLTIQLSPKAVASPGTKSALIQISGPQSNGAPQYLVVTGRVSDSGVSSPPEPDPAGLQFIATTGGSAPAVQQIVTGSGSIVSTFTTDGATWLSALQGDPAKLSVTASPGTLNPGVYFGSVNIGIGSTVRSIPVTFIVKPASSCSVSSIAITPLSLPNNFSTAVGLPNFLQAQLADNCGNPISGATVVAAFSSGDVPLALRTGPQPGLYEATWQPATAAASTVITIRAAAAQLPVVEVSLVGKVDSTTPAPPLLAEGGVVNNLNPQSAAPLAPGTIVQIYGDNMAATPDQPKTAPLPTQLDGVEAFVGGLNAPLYYVSRTQLTAQIPAELQPDQTYSIVLGVNGQFSVPQELDVVAYSPAVAALQDGTLVGQHADYSLVEPNHPAKPGETLLIYLTGLGSTNPGVPSGTAPPANPLAQVMSAPQVTIDNQKADLLFAGMTPGIVGLYQINFIVPATAKPGTLNVSIKQNGVPANSTTLIVGAN